MALVVPPKIKEKLQEKHGVTCREVEQCFANREGGLLMDTREVHKTDPPTTWFIAPTNKGRRLKVVLVQNGSDIFIKTAYEPNQQEEDIYKKKALA